MYMLHIKEPGVSTSSFWHLAVVVAFSFVFGFSPTAALSSHFSLKFAISISLSELFILAVNSFLSSLVRAVTPVITTSLASRSARCWIWGLSLKILARITSQSCRTWSQISQGKQDLFHLTLLFFDL